MAEEDGRLVCFWACLLPCLFVFSPLCSSPQSLLFFLSMQCPGLLPVLFSGPQLLRGLTEALGP